MATRIAIVGYGKIARDQHMPAIRADPAFALVAVISPDGAACPGVPTFPDLGAMLAEVGVDAVAVCTPPSVRDAIAAEALAAGLHVLLEKPPATTMGAARQLADTAACAGLTLFAAWHARHNPAVEAARRALNGATLRTLRIDWLEDVRKWHPGQHWLRAAGGFGVFDPGINALSIASATLPFPLVVRSAELAVPANWQAPIAAGLLFGGGDFRARMDWRHGQSECWRIAIDTADGRRLDLLDGGARLLLDGVPQATDGPAEYTALYARFAELVAARRSDVDLEPLRIVADAFLVGERTLVEPFD